MQFKIRLLFTHAPSSYSNQLPIFLNNDIGDSIGSCEVIHGDNEVYGEITLKEDVDDIMYVYHMYREPKNHYYAILFRNNMLPNEAAMTIAELRI